LPNRPTSDRLLALLAIWALLLCHGVFGALHLIPDPVLQPIAAGEHATTHQPSHAHGVTAPYEHPASHHTDTEYFAVLLGTLLGALYLWLLLRNDRRRDGISTVRRFVSSPPATFSNLPRGPTLPFLQVLRL
jgi:hypothetical protein